MKINLNRGSMSEGTFDSFVKEAIHVHSGESFELIQLSPASNFHYWVYYVELDELELRVIAPEEYSVMRISRSCNAPNA